MKSLKFNQLKNFDSKIHIPPKYFKSSDGVELAYYPYISKANKSMVVFIHGGGAYSEAGYEGLAYNLSTKHDISVCLLDLRGHGLSKGKRGDTPSVLQVYRDLELFIDKIKGEWHCDKIILGGHSSGAGLILNFLDYYDRDDICSYIFVSPQLGYKSKTAKREGENSFVKAKVWVFILNSIFGGKIFGNKKAVFFNYPDSVKRAKPYLLSSISCNFSLALTPTNPQKQFQNLTKPVALYIGEDDEIFYADRVAKFGDLLKESIKNISVIKILKQESHLSILSSVDVEIAEFIDNLK